jgi:hypothetical protein
MKKTLYSQAEAALGRKSKKLAESQLRFTNPERLAAAINEYIDWRAFALARYEEFLTGLAQQSGIQTPTREDLARVDRKRKRKGSNQEWVSPMGIPLQGCRRLGEAPNIVEPDRQ